MSFRSWKPLKLLERGRDERVDFHRALGFAISFRGLELAVLFSWLFNVRVCQP
jgi:hypothetical protein